MKLVSVVPTWDGPSCCWHSEVLQLCQGMEGDRCNFSHVMSQVELPAQVSEPEDHEQAGEGEK